MTDIFPLVLAGHLLGDFVAQTDWQAMNKEANWWADISHTIVYHLVMSALILPFWFTWQAAALITISFATLAFIDRRWPTRLILNVTRSHGFSQMFWGVIATDQALHISILAIATYLLLQ